MVQRHIGIVMTSLSLALMVVIPSVAYQESDLPKKPEDYNAGLQNRTGTCKPGYSFYRVENTHNSRSIRFTVEITTMNQKRRVHRVLEPFEVWEVGCTARASSSQMYRYKFINAHWYDPCPGS